MNTIVPVEKASSFERLKALVAYHDSPFATIFHYIHSLISESISQNGYGKHVLCEALSGILNKKVRLDRRQKGFNAAIAFVFDLKNPKVQKELLEQSSVFDLVRREMI